MTHAGNHLGDSVKEPTEVTGAISGYWPGPTGDKLGGDQKGQRRLIEFFLSPLLKYGQESIRER